MTASSPRGIFSQAELTAERVITRSMSVPGASAGISAYLPASTPSTHLLHWICARLAMLMIRRICLNAAGLQLTLDLTITASVKGVE